MGPIPNASMVVLLTLVFAFLSVTITIAAYTYIYIQMLAEISLCYKNSYPYTGQ